MHQQTTDLRTPGRSGAQRMRRSNASIRFIATLGALALTPMNGGCASNAIDDDPSAVAEEEIIAHGASAKKIAAGEAHTCGIVAEGAVKCWGDNTRRQLGDGTTVPWSQYPVTVLLSQGGPPLKGAKALYAGANSTCALMQAGKVLCWGDNSNGKLGVGATTVWEQVKPYPSPLVGAWDPLTQRDVPASGVKFIAISTYTSCGVFKDDSVKCWGKNLIHGQMENWPTSPSRDSELHGTSVKLGRWHACTQTVDGKVACWGEARDFKLGWRTPSLVGKPVVATVGFDDGTPDGASLQGVSELAVGREHSCVLLPGGKIKCWGLNRDGQLGNGAYGEASPSDGFVLAAPGGQPVEGATAIFAGGSRTCALFKRNQVRCWGDFFVGSAAKPLTSPTAVFDGQLTGLSAFAMGGAHSCAVTTGGVVKCWGRNASGQLGSAGSDPYSDSRTPTAVTLGPGGAPLVVR